MPDESRVAFNIKEKIFVSHHAPHYVTAYKIFLIILYLVGINNFYQESIKEEYVDERLMDREVLEGQTIHTKSIWK